MKHSHAVSVLGAVLLIAISRPLPAAPEDHLAPLPKASEVEAEVIGLLRSSTPFSRTSGEIVLPIYNPTKYALKSCVVRIEIPSEKFGRVYSSQKTNILPNSDGEFTIPSAIYRDDLRDAKVEILKLDYEPAKK